MLEKDLETLRNSLVVPALEGLEAGVWHKVAVDQDAARLRRIVLTCQASVITMVIVGGLAIGGDRPPLSGPS